MVRLLVGGDFVAAKFRRPGQRQQHPLRAGERLRNVTFHGGVDVVLPFDSAFQDQSPQASWIPLWTLPCALERLRHRLQQVVSLVVAGEFPHEEAEQAAVSGELRADCN